MFYNYHKHILQARKGKETSSVLFRKLEKSAQIFEKNPDRGHPWVKFLRVSRRKN